MESILQMTVILCKSKLCWIGLQAFEKGWQPRAVVTTSRQLTATHWQHHLAAERPARASSTLLKMSTRRALPNGRSFADLLKVAPPIYTDVPALSYDSSHKVDMPVPRQAFCTRPLVRSGEKQDTLHSERSTAWAAIIRSEMFM